MKTLFILFLSFVFVLLVISTILTLKLLVDYIRGDKEC